MGLLVIHAQLMEIAEFVADAGFHEKIPDLQNNAAGHIVISQLCIS